MAIVQKPQKIVIISESRSQSNGNQKKSTHLQIKMLPARVMFKFSRLPIAISAAFISSLPFFPAAGIAQEYPGCFMVTSFRQVLALNNICINEKKVCQGPFDRDGFPVILSAQLDQLKAAITRAEKIDSDDAALDAEVLFAVERLLNQPYFSSRTLELQRKLNLLYKQSKNITTREEAVELKKSINATVAELKTDPCYVRLLQVLEKKIPQYSLL